MSRQQNRPSFTPSLGTLSDDKPKGLQLRERLEELIKELPPGAMLPSERVLAEQFGVARMTVRQQIDALAAAQLVTRVLGSGTFATEPRLSQTQVLQSFSEEIAARGMTPHSTILGSETIKADQVMAAGLHVPKGSPVFRLARVRLADGIPLAVERTHLSLVRFPGLDEQPLADGSLHAMLRDQYGCVAATADKRYTLTTLNSTDASLLRVEPGTPAFAAEITVGDAQGGVIEYGNAVLRGDRYEVHISVGSTAT